MSAYSDWRCGAISESEYRGSDEFKEDNIKRHYYNHITNEEKIELYDSFIIYLSEKYEDNIEDFIKTLDKVGLNYQQMYDECVKYYGDCLYKRDILDSMEFCTDFDPYFDILKK